jgi:Sulfotransferase family
VDVTSPVVVLGFSRSGTTLLKQMLDSNPELAMPTESYFLPQLWARHGERPDRETFLDDVARLPRLEDWGVTRADVAERLPAEPEFSQAVQAIYRAYADARGKNRFGDKTPSYMQELELLERAFPGARYVHLVRDGRDAGLSFLALTRRPSFNWARPRSLGAVAVQWQREVDGARRFGRGAAAGRYLELRYEDLVADPYMRMRDVCEFLDLPFDPAMLAYHEAPDAGTLRDHPKLAEPPTPGLRSWHEQMPPRESEEFEAIAGDLLADLGYERAHPHLSARARAWASANRIAMTARTTTWNAANGLARRSPAWRLRQAYNRRRFKPGETP